MLSKLHLVLLKVNSKVVPVLKHHTRKKYGEAELISALDGGQWSASSSSLFNTYERGPRTQMIEGCVGLRPSKEKIPAPAGE
jgi:hypothetical protein